MHTASTVAAFSSKDPAYLLLAGRMYIADIHKGVGRSFSTWVHANASVANLDPSLVRVVEDNYTVLDDAVRHSRDYNMSYPAVQTLVKSYLIHVDADRVERPQFMYMRTAIAIHGNDIPRVIDTYNALSRQLYTHATPTLFNAGTRSPYYASCFLTQPDVHSPRTVLRSVSDLDAFWMADGGVGISLGTVPCRRYGVFTIQLRQPGVLALMRIYDSHANFCILSRDRRPSALTVYLPIWHGDIISFVTCRTARAAPDDKVRHVFPALWIPDIFMKKLRDNADWYLFDPADTPDLNAVYGDQFTQLYEHCLQNIRPVAQIRAADLWRSICEAQTETGAPFIMYQDNVNRRNNQKHMGIIQSSNLCTEVVQYSNSTEPAVCTLASIALPRFIRPDGQFDFDMLHSVTKLAVRNTDRLLDVAKYPTGAAAAAANRARAIGVGVQGLADVFMMMGMPYASQRARDLNVDIFETIYHAALETSCELAKVKGPYPAWTGSLAADGILYSDMWPAGSRHRYDFDALRTMIAQHGLRNSLLTAQMPTASTAYILGNSEGVDPYPRRILSGDYTQICPWLVHDLVKRNLWTDDLRRAILLNHGSVQAIAEIPDDLKDIYRTAWEIDPFALVDMAIDRAPYIEQSQSMSLSIAAPTTPLLMNLQLRAWESGLKTGLYYLRTKAPSYPISYGLARPAPDPDTDSSDEDDDLPPPLEECTPRTECCGA
ncbi:ribonucleotide reductase [Earliella scabrosa]|nr:ribonucleotide reductase [Earliella scabrosa]